MAGALNLRASGIDVVLLDIEGTTTPITFVHDTLFPYARARVRSYLDEHAQSDGEIRQIVADLRLAAGNWPPEADIVSYIHDLMDRDQKSGPLKALQGRIWEEGYAAGALHGEVYPEVRDAFVRWTAHGIRLAIYSSGSVLAQKLLFANSTAGDLTAFLSSYFDTAVGAKREAASYRRIVDTLGVASSRVLFISDVVQELDASQDAGLQTLLCVRSPMQSPVSSTHGTIEDFGALS